MSKEKIKVLQFTVAAGKGGRTLYVLNNWKHIDKSKFQFDFITFSSTLDFEQELLDEGCKVFHMSCYPSENRERFIQELDVILDQGYDVIHIHTSYWADTIVEERAKAKGIKKIIIHSHNTGHGKHNFTKEQETEAIAIHNSIREQLTEDIATDFWACSWLAAEWLYGERIPKTKIRILNNAIDTSKFAFDEIIRKKYRDMLGIGNEYLIGVVGRLSHQKNQDFLLRVFNKICKERKDYKLLIVGQGEKEAEFRAFVHENGLETNVIFTGFRTDVNCLLQAMDCLCMPSRFEGLGIALIEAQASGVECFVSDAIPDEAVLTDLVTRVPLKEELWIEKILQCSKHDRIKYQEVVTKAGFEVKIQIGELEGLYAD